MSHNQQNQFSNATNLSSPIELSAEKIQDFQAAFSLMDSQSKGFVGPEDINLVAQAADMKMSENEAQLLLGSADEDHSGGIDMREFISIMTTPINQQDLEEELRATFRVFDKDGNGTINASELKRFVRLWDTELTEDEADDMISQAYQEMSSDILAIVEFGAQKQRIPLNIQSSYEQICQQIYALFQLDPTKSKYLLQQQDLVTPGAFTTVDKQKFLGNLLQYAANRKNNIPIRLRLMPLNMKIHYKTDHENTNGTKVPEKAAIPNDEIDRISVKSATNSIDIKELIKKCLRNLQETTENIQLLDRCLHPEDYLDDESISTQVSTPNIDQSAISVNMPNNDQVSSASDSRQSAPNLVDELIPALNHILETPKPQPPPPTIPSHFDMKPLPAESPVSSIPPTTSLPQPSFTPKAPSTVSSRTSNKSFSNRLGMIQPNPTSTSTSTRATPVPLETKPLTFNSTIESKAKSPLVLPKQSTIPQMMNESLSSERSMAKEISAPAKLKCQIELKQFEPASTVEGIVSVASNASYFFLQLVDDKKDEFDRFSKQLHDYYSNLDKNAHFRPTPGDYCVAMYTEDARWYRARLIRYVSDQICEVFYVDYGNLEELPIDLVHELLPAFARLPARAIACTIAEILPPVGQEGWTKRATFAFASRCSSERVQAIVVDSTNIRWPMHMVQLRVLKTDEDISTSLEECKVARRVSNQEICEFWLNKIRVEQYVLYNLPEPNLTRFPFIEQGTSSYFHYMTSHGVTFSPSTLVNIYDENFHRNIDKVSKDLAFVYAQ